MLEQMRLLIRLLMLDLMSALVPVFQLVRQGSSQQVQHLEKLDSLSVQHRPGA
jgi:hypothetical protein